MKLTDKIQMVEELTELVIEGYGSPEEFAKVLNFGVEMLFYVEEEAFTQQEIQQVVSAIRGVIGVLRG
ncbi:hypothetical protein [Flagellimonas algicola]|uniref:Uncharacterized protein n=1 Tax=Flagellimonas algicola TaxID=2583815 RepID=A0ABY2WHD1_9FLAO|nr:hypothetical protein [Allomuricauda algicola]TMU50998.1 hypothetical protein FGG15_17395 [Allomuricauda algicola]